MEAAALAAVALALAVAPAEGRAAPPAAEEPVLLRMVEDVLQFASRAAPRPHALALVCWGAVFPGVGGEAGTMVQAAVDAARRRRTRLGGPPDLFLVDLACPAAATLLRQADEQELLKDPFRWLLLDREDYFKSRNQTYTSPGAEDLEDKETASQCDRDDGQKCNDTNIAVGEVKNEDWENNCGYIDKAAAVAAEAAGAQRGAQLGLRSALPDSQVLLARVSAAGGGGAQLLELHRVGWGKALLATAVGAWRMKGREGGGVCWRAAHALPARRRNLHQVALNASMVVTNPDTLNHLEDTVNKHIDTITKVNYALTNHAFEILNASVRMLVVDTWGYATNGSWSGMVGDLQHGRAEVGATALFVTAERLPVIEYIAMTTPTRAGFVFRQPPLSYVSNLFTLPFNTSVWLASSALLALAAALLLLAARFEAQAGAGGGAGEGAWAAPDPGRLRPRWSDVAMLTLGAVCQQGSPTESRGVSGRIVSFMLFVFVIFLYTSYSANIVALLQSSTSSIRTLSDLLNSRLEVGVHDIVYNRHYFKVASDPVRRALYQKKVAPSSGKERFMPLEDGIARVRKGLFAFHSELSSGYHFIQDTFREDEKCGLQSITFLQVVDPYWALKKNSPYRELFRVAFRAMLERGVQTRAMRRLYTKKPQCVGKGSSFVSVGLVECYPALLVLVYGGALALAALAAELLLRRRILASVREFRQ